jgi:hypothetical protein
MLSLINAGSIIMNGSEIQEKEEKIQKNAGSW